MERTRVNIAVGLFVVLGILALGYLSIKLGRVSLLGAALMVAAGLIAALFCVPAERKPLESVARPLAFID